MKKVLKNKWIILTFTLIIGIIIGKLISPSIYQPISPSAHQHIKQSANQVWTCSMHPQIRMDKPGKCPICGMELIPLSKGDNMSSFSRNETIMSPEAMKLADIQTTSVIKAKPVKEIRLLGRVKPDETKLYSQTSHIPGRIEKLYVNFTGEKVSAGQKLAKIYSPEMITAQKELFESMKSKKTYPELYTASRNKLKLWKLSEQQIDAIEQERKVMENMDLLSDYNGYVLKKEIELGEHLMEGSVLYEIADLSTVWIMFEGYEADLPWIHLQDKVTFTAQSLHGKKLTGTITYIDPFVDIQTRVAKIRVEIPNPDMKLLPEMFVNGVIHAKLSTKENTLIIPKSAVLWTGKKSVVYIKKPNTTIPTFVFREIVLGEDAGNFYVVADGLYEGEEIATHGVFKIDAAAQLAGKQSMMNKKEKKEEKHLHQNDNSQEIDKINEKLVSAQFKVYGNCEMCKERIEETGYATNGVRKAIWNMDSKILEVMFNQEQTSKALISKAITNSGHDTEWDKADLSDYKSLPECCQYARGKK